MAAISIVWPAFLAHRGTAGSRGRTPRWQTLAPLGLHLSHDGKISERSFIDTLRQTVERDAALLKVFDVNRPAHPCFGIDHATISGARDFTQGGITMGACYKKGSLLSEQKHVTLYASACIMMMARV